MRQKKVKEHMGRGRLSLIACVVTVFVLLFIGSAIAAIVYGGVVHFGDAMADKEVLFALRLSATTALISTSLCLILAIPVAYALVYVDFRGKKIIEIILELTLSLPYILIGIALLILFSSPFGRFLDSIGFKVVFTPLGIVIAQLTVNLPFAIRLARTAFASLDQRWQFIAYALGASEQRYFFRIILPNARRSLTTTFITVFSRAMGEFGATLMLVGITRLKTETLPGAIYLAVSTGNTDMAMSIATIMLVVSGLSLFISNLVGREKRDRE